MNCHHLWPREFLDDHLSRTWREGELRHHREKILFDRERSLLPATQPHVEIEIQKRAYAAEVAALNVQESHLQEMLKDVWKKIADAAESPALYVQESHLVAMLHDVQAKRTSRLDYIRDGPTVAEAKEAKEKSLFIAACPTESCRGFLSTAYKCGTCATQFCSGCRERKVKGIEHACDPALVATIAAIVKDSRPCPRCGTAISKVSGCDQMYCTQCDTPFSYERGTVINGIIHNPHYFERLQKLKTSVAANAAAAQTGCNGWPDFRFLPAHIHANPLFGTLFRNAAHVSDVTLRGMPTTQTVIDNRKLRVRYLMNELDEKTFKQLIQQRDRTRQRELEIRAVLELFVITVMEFFNDRATLADTAKTTAALTTLQAQMETTMNVPLRAIGERYNSRVPFINTAACYIDIYGNSLG